MACRPTLDRKFDEMLAAVTGPGGRLVIERDEQGPGDRRQFPGDPADVLQDLLRAERPASKRSSPATSG